MILKTFATKIAITVFVDVLKKGIRSFQSSKTEYEKELGNIIQESLDEYRKKYPIADKTKTAFYDSEIFLTQLLRFRFLEKFDNQSIVENVINDERIHPPSENELLNFLEIFDAKMEASLNFRELAVDKNYKEEVFKISDLLKKGLDEISVQLDKNTDAILQAISKLNINSTLKKIWHQQIDEIKENLESFKPFIAKERLMKLEKQISENGDFSDNKLKAKFLVLKGLCEQEITFGEFSNKDSELFIQAWKLDPTKLEHKVHATLGFYALNDFEKTAEIANSVIEISPYNINAWAALSFISDDIKSFIINEVPQAVKSKNGFKVHVGYWLLIKRVVIKLSDLHEIGLSINYESVKVPDKITFDNKNYWRVVAQNCLALFSEQNPVKFLFQKNRKARKDYLFNLTNQLLEKIVNAFKGTELESKYAFLKFQLHYTNFQISHDESFIPKLEVAYDEIKNKMPEQVFQMVQVINSIPSEQTKRKAIQIISDFGEEKYDILAFTKSTLHHVLKEDKLSWESFKIFLTIHKKINLENLYNIMQHFSILYKDNVEGMSEKINFVNSNCEFLEPKHKELFLLFGNVICEVPIQNFNSEKKIDELCKVIVEDSSLISWLGAIIMATQNFDKAEQYLSKHIDIDKPNYLLRYYCEALYYGKLKIPKLLEILKYWREHFIPDYKLLKIELDIRLNQINIPELYLVSKKGVELFPKDEVFLSFYFNALSYYSNVEETRDSLHLLKNFQFENEMNAIRIVAALRKVGFFKKSLELIYSLAIEKDNIQARQAYFNLNVVYPDNLFRDYEKVEHETFVKIQMNEKIQIITIKNRVKEDSIAELLLGKSKGDIIDFPTPMQKVKNKEVIILRIMDKYLALFEEIILESEDPVAGIPIRKVEFDEEFSIENFNEVLMEEFGEEEDNRNQLIKERLNEFYAGDLTFSEIIAKVFGRKNIEGYFHLTSSQNKCFRVLPAALALNPPFDEKTKFILDATSFCLFYELYREEGVSFDHKFVISSFLKRELEFIVDETKIQPSSKMSINISSDGVVPTFYPDDFKEKRLAYFEGMLKWMNTHCEVDYVDEKLGELLKAKEKMPVDEFANNFLDNWTLMLRENYILLTSDLFYFKQFGVVRDKIISPEVYLENFHAEKSLKISSYFLKKKYLGTNVRHEILFDEFFKWIATKDEDFAFCLQNLHFIWNPNVKNIDEVVIFLKKIFLHNSIHPDTKGSVALGTFSNLLTGMPPQNIIYLKQKIDEEFKLIENSRMEVLKILIYVLDSAAKGSVLK